MDVALGIPIAHQDRGKAIDRLLQQARRRDREAGSLHMLGASALLDPLLQSAARSVAV